MSCIKRTSPSITIVDVFDCPGWDWSRWGRWASGSTQKQTTQTWREVYGWSTRRPTLHNSTQIRNYTEESAENMRNEKRKTKLISSLNRIPLKASSYPNWDGVRSIYKKDFFFFFHKNILSFVYSRRFSRLPAGINGQTESEFNSRKTLQSFMESRRNKE